MKLSIIPLGMLANEESNGGRTLRTLKAADTNMLTRLNKALFPLQAGRLSSSASDLSERATIHCALFFILNGFYILLCISLHVCTVFNLHHSKEWPLFLLKKKSSVLEVVNCI